MPASPTTQAESLGLHVVEGENQLLGLPTPIHTKKSINSSFNGAASAQTSNTPEALVSHTYDGLIMLTFINFFTYLFRRQRVSVSFVYVWSALWGFTITGKGML